MGEGGMSIGGRGTGTLPLAAAGLLVVIVGCAPGGTSPASGPEPERVSIAYGTRDRADVMGAVGSVTREDLDEARGMRLVDVLQSRVTGVEVYRRPDGDYSVRIRGAHRDMQGEPLVVVDGLPIHSNMLMSVLSSLSTQSVARIDVLKDAGETAAYGIRGGNGVIVITTNRGR
jgi:TonB-dependent SusC/RagA subfamily outer membrane receptor